MHIVIDSYLKGPVNQSLRQEFTRKILENWQHLFPEDKLTLLGYHGIADKEAGVFPKIIHSPKSAMKQSPAGMRYHYLLPRTLKKSGAEIFLSLFGSSPLRLGLAIVAADFQTSVQEAGTKSWFSAIRQKNLFKKSSAVVLASQYQARNLLEEKGSLSKKIQVVYPGPFSDEIPLTPAERANILKTLTGGREYFYYCGNPSADTHFTDLLKGFSAFKKRQKTHMQLVIPGERPQGGQLSQLISSYLFRTDLHFTGVTGLTENRNIAGSAYAAWSVAANPVSEIEILRMMRLGVPVICNEAAIEKYFPEGSILSSPPAQPTEINRQLTSIFLDEHKRSAMIGLGLKYSGSFTWQKTVQEIREILKAVISRAVIP